MWWRAVRSRWGNYYTYLILMGKYVAQWLLLNLQLSNKHILRYNPADICSGYQGKLIWHRWGWSEGPCCKVTREVAGTGLRAATRSVCAFVFVVQ